MLLNIFKKKCGGLWCNGNRIERNRKLCDFCTKKNKEQAKRLRFDATHTTKENRYNDLPIGTEVAFNEKKYRITGYRYVADGLFFSKLTTYYELNNDLLVRMTDLTALQ